MTNKLTKEDLLNRLQDETGLAKTDIDRVLGGMAKLVATEASFGTAVPFPGLGTFKPADRNARTGRNPKTGEAVDIPAKRVLTFKPAKDAAERVNG